MRFRSEQPPYSMLARGIEADVLPVCQRLGMGVLTWSPLAWGFLSGKYRKGSEVDLAAGRPRWPRTASIPPSRPTPPSMTPWSDWPRWRTRPAAALPQLAVAFAAAHPAVSSVILGPRTMTQLTDLLAGATLALDDKTLDRIDEIVPPGTNVYDPNEILEAAGADRRRAAAAPAPAGPQPDAARPAGPQPDAAGPGIGPVAGGGIIAAGQDRRPCVQFERARLYPGIRAANCCSAAASTGKDALACG